MTSHDAIEFALFTFYEIISGHKTKKRAWDQMRSLFYPGALLFPNSITQNPTGSHGMEIDSYLQSLDRFLSENDFFEQGTISHIMVENNIASVISTYEARRTLGDQHPFKHGVNFVHFVCTEHGWKITSMIWQDL